MKLYLATHADCQITVRHLPDRDRLVCAFEDWLAAQYNATGGDPSFNSLRAQVAHPATDEGMRELYRLACEESDGIGDVTWGEVPEDPALLTRLAAHTTKLAHIEKLAAEIAASTGSALRLQRAEELLSDLATGYWVAMLDEHDDPVKERMGQRILNYWRLAEAEASTTTATAQAVGRIPCIKCGTPLVYARPEPNAICWSCSRPGAPSTGSARHEIHRLLTASTAHVPEFVRIMLMDPDGPCPLLATDEYGAWLRTGLGKQPAEYAEEDAATTKEWDPELTAVLAYARNLGCAYLRLDTDGPKYPDLPTFAAE